MNRHGLAQGIIDALPEPAFLLAADGRVIGANRAARAALGERVATGSIADLLASPGEELQRYLGRCSRTTMPLPGALDFRTGEVTRRFRAHCARLGGRSDEVVLLLRCSDPQGDRFSILARRIRRLDAELRDRVREKAVLREALDEKRTLMRELQHRVKNNIQMMISLLSMSAASGGSPELRAFVAGAQDRFRALATTQDLIYEAQASSAIPARELFGRLAQAVVESTDGAVEAHVDIADVWLPQESAHCAALILNELLTNSIKHGTSGTGAGGAGTIRVTLGRDGDELRLVIQDDGPGYPDLETMPRSSGLTLIRGLCRQIGAGLEFGNEGGARTTVIFADAGAPPAQAAAPPAPDAARQDPAETTPAST
ncbi:MAG TPA: histidine kinase dimerization/phosphoacceptor domain -containing protein [Paracoccaceae bacterium]|nr:histidine kinase dimerization/phosphoacceptor domain -containing protein [Paracoccaceae bacterium]